MSMFEATSLASADDFARIQIYQGHDPPRPYHVTGRRIRSEVGIKFKPLRVLRDSCVSYKTHVAFYHCTNQCIHIPYHRTSNTARRADAE